MIFLKSSSFQLVLNYYVTIFIELQDVEKYNQKGKFTWNIYITVFGLYALLGNFRMGNLTFFKQVFIQICIYGNSKTIIFMGN